MMRWAWRSLLAEPATLLAGVIGLAATFVLILLMKGIVTGEADHLVAYPEHIGADLWVLQSGVRNLHMSVSALSDGTVARVEAVEGVQDVTEVLYAPLFVESGDRKWLCYIVGTWPGGALGGAWSVQQGKRRPAAGEAIVPVPLARKAGLDLGDRVMIGNRPFQVGGLSEGTFSLANTVVFMTFGDLESLLDTFATVSHLLVRVKAGQEPAKIAARIRASVEDIEVLTMPELVRRDRSLETQMGASMVALMSRIGAAVGALVVAWLVFSIVARNSRELAVTKAIGATGYQIVAAVLLQSVLVAAVGFLVAVVVALLLQPGLTRWVPDVSIRFALDGVLHLGGVALLISALAALVPAFRVLRLDPAEAFK